jgi:uncharacterized protein YwqG
MNPKMEIELPDELLIYKEKIEATIQPYIEIKAKPEDDLRLWQSKFGGLPYFPKYIQYPKDSKGQAMFLIAQINFAETPKLESFPQKGILQFYISGTSDLYGMSFENQTRQDDFRVLFFSEVDENECLLITEFDFLPKPVYLPIRKQSSLAFSLKYAPVPWGDYQFESKIFNIDPKLKYEHYKNNQGVHVTYGKLFRSTGHKIGGYPYFTQTDPRESEKYSSEEYRLLFQMDTDGKADIMWGDVGVANFFITQSDLENKDFSRVLYNWDCS